VTVGIPKDSPEIAQSIARQRKLQRGLRIKAAREKQGLSIRQLANMLNTDVTVVRNWEAGKTQPFRKHTMEALLCVLGLKIEQL
jgi:DNA-binding transcriptional regulator YiaG